MAVACDEIVKNSWIFLENPSDKEVDLVVKQTGVNEDLIKAALDEEERARIEIDDNAKLIIVDVPIIEEENDNWYIYTTQPLGIIVHQDYLITVCIKAPSVLTDFLGGRIKNFDLNKRTRFIYQILYNNAVKFLQNLRQIDKASNKVQAQLHKSMNNKELLQLLDLEKSLVYFSTSLNANQIVLDKMINSRVLAHFEEDQDLLDDVIVENRQAIEMCNVHKDVLSGTMDAFASVISNNQNIVMKFLAAVTILLAIPQMIAALFGMNVTGIPFGTDSGVAWGFWIVTGISIACMVVTFIIMIKRKMF